MTAVPAGIIIPRRVNDSNDGAVPLGKANKLSAQFESDAIKIEKYPIARIRNRFLWTVLLRGFRVAARRT
jgi:hypothetical protein